MRIGTTAVAAVLAVGFSVGPGAQSSLERTMDQWLELAAASFLRNLVPLGAPRVWSPKSRESRRVEFYLEAGVEYGVMTTCDCEELEVAMRDSRGLVLAPKRTQIGRTVALWVRPAASGPVGFDVVPDGCYWGGRCSLGTQLFRVD